MNVSCPRCDTVYRVDPARVPDAGVVTRCSACRETFRVEGEASDTAPGAPEPSAAAPEREAQAPTPGAAAGTGVDAGPTPTADAGVDAGDDAPPAPAVESGPEPATSAGAEARAPTEPSPTEPSPTEPSPTEPSPTEPAGASQSPAEGAVPGEAPAEPAVPGETGAGTPAASTPSAETSEAPAPERPAFGPQDPHLRAKRIARALVSDITVYHPERVEKSRADGTLRKDFRDEILKSWDEYVEQVGEEMARGTNYFREALNQILAQGENVF